MFLKEITIQNLLSYNEKQRILFTNNSIILGTNNSGKSNIFRIITILINELLHHNYNLYEQLTFSNDEEPYINIKLQFNDTEVDLLIDYLFYIYGIQVPDPYMGFIINYPNLRILLKDISIRMNWYKYSLQEYMTSKIEIEFENLKLSLIATEGSYEVKFDNKSYFLSYQLVEQLGKLKSSNFEDIKSHLKNVLDYQEPQQSNLYLLHKKLQIPPEGMFPPQLKRITNIKNYIFFDNIENIDFLIFIGHLIRNNIIFKIKSEIQSVEEDDDNNFQLNNKGNNLARFLFKIKNSNSYIERYKFTLIQEYFSQIFENLSIDVIREYHTENKKYIIKIIIYDKEINKDLDFDFIGEGIKEIIFLLSLSLGVDNKVMCFDEPALNFHPLLLKSVFNKITSTNIKNNNQFIIITHSLDLTDHMIFDRNSTINYIKKNKKGSIINLPDDNIYKWFEENKKKFRHIINSQIFFTKLVILVEGQSDEYFVGILQYFHSNDLELDLIKNDILIIGVGGKDNFSKYKKIIDMLNIQTILIGDSGTEKERSNKRIFFSASEITKDGIIRGNNSNILIIREGNLENLMESIDKNIYDNCVKFIKSEYGKGENKPAVAFEFVSQLNQQNSSKLKVFKDLKDLIIDNLNKN